MYTIYINIHSHRWGVSGSVDGAWVLLGFLYFWLPTTLQLSLGEGAFCLLQIDKGSKFQMNNAGWKLPRMIFCEFICHVVLFCKSFLCLLLNLGGSKLI
jgi:hypothetical protein